MGMLIEGRWHTEDKPRANADGEFVRPTSAFRGSIAPGGKHPPVAGRYHLFVNAGCPWAYRTILYRSIKQLQSIVSISFTRPAAGEQGWTFGEPDELLGAVHLHQVYSQADPTFSGRATVPVLWDKQLHTIVNNESADIIRQFNSAFDGLPGVDPGNYYPAELAEPIDELNEHIYQTVNNGVYRCGFAQSQAAYNDAFEALFATLDELDARLAQQRYLCGERLTEADWRLFATLIRFDLAYHGQFRCNRNLLQEFAHLWPYTRDLYQTPGVRETVDVAAIKGIYYGSRPPGIIPLGPRIDFDAPHGRG